MSIGKKILVASSLSVLLLGLLYGYFVSSVEVTRRLSNHEINPASDTVSVGRLFMIGHWANTPVASTTALIEEHQLAGVIIMSTPENALEITDWVAEWNKVSEEPLLIAIDQEGGPVTRLRGAGFTETSQRDISTTEAARALGLQRGQELAALGINMNFSPVLDRASSPDSFMFERTFPSGTNEPLLAASMAEGMAEAGVIAVAKHFPGHADTSDDSHFVLPKVTLSKADLPDFTSQFTNYISLAQPKALMTAHVLFPEIDDEPATLSRYFLTDYLRDQLGFSGVIITDDMSMDAIDSKRSTSEAALLSIAAGANIILFAAEPELVTAAITTVAKELLVNESLQQTVLLANTQNREILPGDF